MNIRKLLCPILLLLFSVTASAEQEAFGLQFGMSMPEVALRTGELEPDPDSVMRNAFLVEHLPDEKTGIPARHAITKRSVYFDDQGRLWRVRVVLNESECEHFEPNEAMSLYELIKASWSTEYTLRRVSESAPNIGKGIDTCKWAAEWRNKQPGEYALASEIAPHLSFNRRVNFDIGCGAIGPWEATFAGADRVHRTVTIRDGNLYFASVVVTAAQLDEGDASPSDKIKRMRHNESTPLKPKAARIRLVAAEINTRMP